MTGPQPLANAGNSAGKLRQIVGLKRIVITGIRALTEPFHTTKAFEAILVGATDGRLVALPFAAAPLIPRTGGPLPAPAIVTTALNTDSFTDAVPIVLADLGLLAIKKLHGTTLSFRTTTGVGCFGAGVDNWGATVKRQLASILRRWLDRGLGTGDDQKQTKGSEETHKPSLNP
tara:strand:- start:1959 stop:2480 length:522 start_codon:yes stop_codon:yes gene_type:complete